MIRTAVLGICLFVLAAAGSALATGSVSAQEATPTEAMMESSESVPAGAPETGRI